MAELDRDRFNDMALVRVPIFTYRWPESDRLNDELHKVIVSRRANSTGVRRTNSGGWQSENDLAKWFEPSVKTLTDRILTMTKEVVRRTCPECTDAHLEGWSVEAWANVNEYGHFNLPHEHEGGQNMWSGVYYVDVGDLRDGTTVSGKTCFEDRTRMPKEVILDANPYSREIKVMPENGTMVMFPATQSHYVEPYTGRGSRTTIAFNLAHDGFVIPQYSEETPLTWKGRAYQKARTAAGDVGGKLRTRIKDTLPF